MSAHPPTAAEVHALFERAIDLEAEPRTAMLDEACAGRPDLRARVEALLASDAERDTLLDAEPEQVWATLLDDGAVGRTVGPYRIMSELGRGGMGAVYLAERADGEFDQRVALKLVKRGMDTDDILARFRHERRILATLEHPNIARLYDGGASEDGRPYLVMELVDGEAITSYCDRERLSINQRLALFRTICAAVQHAHQKLVVHRDLKPSNILVAKDGTPKLLDFGIAKLLAADDSAPRTRTGSLVLTPEYAAPEQIRGEPVTTATDVFALGAVLYELLTAKRPFARDRGSDIDTVRNAVRPSAVVATVQSSAAARSTTQERLRRRLIGDMDTIVLRALAPEVGMRYASAQQLLDDLERHRAGLPIHARAQTLAYRARKFVRRNRSALLAGTLVVLTLISGLGATFWQAQRATRERDAAELARANAEQVTTFLLNMFDSADPLGVRMERTDTLRVREIVDRGAARVRGELAGQPRVQSSMMTMLGRVYSNLGLYTSAEDMLEEALRLTTGRGNDAREQVVPLTVLATIANQQGAFARADSLLARAIALHDAADRPPDSLYVSTISERGVTLSYLGDYDGSMEIHQRALTLIDSLQLEGRPLHGHTLNNLGTLLYNTAEYDRAIEVFQEALELERGYLGPDHPRLAATLNNLASSTHYAGRLAESEPIYLEAISTGRAALGDEHSEVGVYLQNLASLYDDQGLYEKAEPVYVASIHAHEASLGRENVHTALLLRNFALNRLDAGQLDHAEALSREALASIQAGLGPEHLYTGVTDIALGRVLTVQGAYDQAHGHLTRGLDLLESQLPPEHYLMLSARRDLGAHFAARGEYGAAEPILRAAYEAVVEENGPDHHLTNSVRQELRDMYVNWGKPDAAEQY